jgi:hypothetical protein
MNVVEAMLEDDRARVCGPRYAHVAQRRAHRAGHADGELVLGGRRVRVRRPRARTVDDREVALPTWEFFACEDPLDERAFEQMVLGVSTRNYARSLEPLPPDLVARGTSRSAVSRRFVARTEETLRAIRSRDLGTLSLCAMAIDGIHVGEHLVVVALGIDESGENTCSGCMKARPRTSRCARRSSPTSWLGAYGPTARCCS